MSDDRNEAKFNAITDDAEALFDVVPKEHIDGYTQNMLDRIMFAGIERGADRASMVRHLLVAAMGFSSPKQVIKIIEQNDGLYDPENYDDAA